MFVVAEPARQDYMHGLDCWVVHSQDLHEACCLADEAAASKLSMSPDNCRSALGLGGSSCTKQLNPHDELPCITCDVCVAGTQPGLCVGGWYMYGPALPLGRGCDEFGGLGAGCRVGGDRGAGGLLRVGDGGCGGCRCGGGGCGGWGCGGLGGGDGGCGGCGGGPQVTPAQVHVGDEAELALAR